MLIPGTNPNELELHAENVASDTPESYKDGAICLQVLGQKQTEEKVLACMRVIDGALGRSENHMV